MIMLGYVFSQQIGRNLQQNTRALRSSQNYMKADAMCVRVCVPTAMGAQSNTTLMHTNALTTSSDTFAEKTHYDASRQLCGQQNASSAHNAQRRIAALVSLTFSLVRRRRSDRTMRERPRLVARLHTYLSIVSN